MERCVWTRTHTPHLESFVLYESNYSWSHISGSTTWLYLENVVSGHDNEVAEGKKLKWNHIKACKTIFRPHPGTCNETFFPRSDIQPACVEHKHVILTAALFLITNNHYWRQAAFKGSLMKLQRSDTSTDSGLLLDWQLTQEASGQACVCVCVSKGHHMSQRLQSYQGSQGTPCWWISTGSTHISAVQPLSLVLWF